MIHELMKTFSFLLLLAIVTVGCSSDDGGPSGPCQDACELYAPRCGIGVGECLTGCGETPYPDSDADVRRDALHCLENAHECSEAQACVPGTWPAA